MAIWEGARFKQVCKNLADIAALSRKNRNDGSVAPCINLAMVRDDFISTPASFALPLAGELSLNLRPVFGQVDYRISGQFQVGFHKIAVNPLTQLFALDAPLLERHV